MTLPDSHIMDYVVHRTVTDKLQETLNGMAKFYEELTATFTGGRDWIVVGVRGHDLANTPTPYGNTSKEDRDAAAAAGKVVRVN